MIFSQLRELDRDTLELLYKVKLHGQILDELVQEVRLHVADQRAAALALPDGASAAELLRLQQAQPEQWTAAGRTSLQQAMMFLTRAVTQPAAF